MSVPMRVALVDPSLFTAPYDQALAAGLAHGKAEVTLLGRPLRPGEAAVSGARLAFDPCFYRLSEGPASRLPEALRMPLKAIEHLFGMVRLGRRLESLRPSVIHFQWLPRPRHDLRRLPRLRKIAPVVLTVHDSEPWQRELEGRWTSSELARAVDLFIVHTEAAAQRLRSMGIEARAVVVQQHPALPLPPDLVVSPFRPPVTAVVVLGELKPYKGLDLLLEALAIAGSGSQLRLVVAGRPRMDVEPLRRRCRDLGLEARVEWRLHRLDERELAEVLETADAFALPYRRADASGVLSLALALGRPIVASRVGVAAELLTDGVDALLVPPGDVLALAGALERLADDQVAAMLAAGSAKAASRLGSWEEVGVSHLEAYRGLVDARRREAPT